MRFALLDVLAPTGCAGCGSGGAPLCSACLPAFTVAAWRVPSRPPPAYAAAVYHGPVRTAIIAYKERGRREHAPLLAGLLARAVSAFHVSGHAGGPGPPFVLVPVPTRRAAALRRGDHPVARLAGLAAQTTGATVLDVLRYTRPVADQAALGATARAANLAGAFHVPPRRRATLHAALAPAARAARALDPRALDPRALDPRALDPRALDPRAPDARAPDARAPDARAPTAGEPSARERAARAPAARGSGARAFASSTPAVIVVDDVRTTGATLAEAVRALGEAGCRVSGVAVAAASVLRVAGGWAGGVGDGGGSGGGL